MNVTLQKKLWSLETRKWWSGKEMMEKLASINLMKMIR